MITVVKKKSLGWERGYNLLWDFYRREGHVQVPEGHIEDDFDLGAWVVEQRRKRAIGKLSPIEEVKLSTIKGWTWDKLTA